MPTFTPIIQFGLGGSLLARATSLSTHYKGWAMQMTNDDLSVDQLRSVLTSPTGWSSGDSLTVFNAPLINQPSHLPEGGSAIRLNGSSQYLASVFDETTAPNDIGPQSYEIVCEIHSLPGVGEEPAVMGGSSAFAVTCTASGTLRGWYNGVAVVESAAVTLNTPLHIVYLRNAASPNDTVRLWVNGVQVSATPTTATITRGRIHLGKHWSNAHYLEATYSLAWVYAHSLLSGDVEGNLGAVAWTDVTTDTDGKTELMVERGIRDDGPLARVAGTSFARFALKNLANSGNGGAGLLGYYSPGHANVRPGFASGIPCRVLSFDGSDTEVQFVGRVRTIAPAPGKQNGLKTKVIATDVLDDAARFRLNQVPILENVRGDQVFRSIVARLPNQPSGVRADAGSETYDLALDNTRDEAVPMLGEFVRLAQSERGRIYTNRLGTLVYENRASRITDHPTADLALTDTMVALDVSEISADALNRVEVTVHPRIVDVSPTTVLFALANALQIGVGETRSIVGTYVAVNNEENVAERVGGIDMQPPVPGTDYTMNSAADGSGSDLTASLTVVVSYGANGLNYQLTNTSGTPGFITRLHARGKGIYDFRPVVVVAENPDAITRNGVNAVAWDMPYQEDPAVGQETADALLAAYEDLQSRARQVTVLPQAGYLPAGLMERDISHRIALSESVTGINEEYYIKAVVWRYQNGRLNRLTWWLDPTVEDDALAA